MDPTPTSPEALGWGRADAGALPLNGGGGGREPWLVQRPRWRQGVGTGYKAVAGEGLCPRIALQFGGRAPASTVRRYAASLGAEAGVIAPNPR